MENKIKVVLVDKKRTNKWLAEQMGCSPTTVSKWCTNVCQPPMETFVRIAELLEVDINELLRIEKKPSQIYLKDRQRLILIKYAAYAVKYLKI